ncbi:P-loop containing nucleoside triphosphate hydrolase protein [Hypoxylon fragiforme]|uniref:P-loop containing nucleoside triphosphate hydrolase protein n=1 Tax=Hypoxylon fragiforme TaxID=63214 RepID=UPI0020C61E62|nr:P-loop containing nucleoside triphosphate hydrolase protein [Hypoxylon fragiforme]KAI2614410.1 P-loop containing nucleoside triphosphate hydrolase protein [Hypoxylon fragiforme]
MDITAQINAALLSDDGAMQTTLRNITSALEEQVRHLEDQVHAGNGVTNSATATTSTQVTELLQQVIDLEILHHDTQALYDAALADVDHWKAELAQSQQAKNSREKQLKQELEAERQKVRTLFEQVQSLKGNIRVMCRIRPAPVGTPEEDLVDFGPRERGDFSTHWGKLRITTERMNFRGQAVQEQRSFEFERIFGPDETNEDIFKEISDLTECALTGEKVGIFAYGQTGSGKTFTLSHNDPQKPVDTGLIPRTLGLIFDTINSSTDKYNYTVSMSILEVYVDNVYDLLQTGDEGEKIQVRLEQAVSVELDSEAMAAEMIDAATSIRETSATNRNETSSRSHLILTFQIRRRDNEQRKTVTGILNIVDLAGSERSAAGGLQGQQLREGIKINESLMSLNMAITSLGQGGRIAFDTALLRALRPVLSNDSKTLMFVMISPFQKDLTISLQTLEKGQEATNAKLASANRSSNFAGTVSAPATPVRPIKPTSSSPTGASASTSTSTRRTPTSTGDSRVPSFIGVPRVSLRGGSSRGGTAAGRGGAVRGGAARGGSTRTSPAGGAAPSQNNTRRT